MKAKIVFFVMSILFIILSNNKVYSYDKAKRDSVKKCYPYLNGKNLSNADLSYLRLSSSFLSNANLSNSTLSGTDLTDATLTDATLSDTDLTDAKVKGADFDGVTGLTNKQKGYLYAHGAINVPPYDPNEPEETDPYWLAKICEEKIDAFMKAIFKKSFHFIISLPKHIKKQIMNRLLLTKEPETKS